MNKKEEDIIQKYIVAKISREEALSQINQSTFYAHLHALGYYQRTHVYSLKFGYKRKDDKDFWKVYHEEYINNDITLKELGERIGVDCTTLRRTFEKNGFERKDKKDSIRVRNNRSIETLKKKYDGAINPSQVPKIKEKIKKTCQDRYGADSPFSSEIVREKILESIRKKYDNDSIENVFQAEEVIEKNRNHYYRKKIEKLLPLLRENKYELLEEYRGTNTSIRYKIKCLRCNSIFEDDVLRIPRCKICFPFNKSIEENNYKEFIENLGFNVENNKKMIIRSRFSKSHWWDIDLFVQNLNIGFEYNHLYTHAYYNGNKHIDNIDYHQYKTEECLKKGIKLFHI